MTFAQMPTPAAPVRVSSVALARRLPELYLACVLLVTLLLCLLTPPFFVPDEAHHALRAMELARGELLAHPHAGSAGTAADSNVEVVMDHMTAVAGDMERRFPLARLRPDGRVTRADLLAVQHLPFAHQDRFADFQNTAVYPPMLYLPDALGWRVGERAGLSVVHTLLLARVLASLSAAALGWLALRLCRCGQLLLFGFLLLPTALSLQASDSQDALLFSMAALLMAVLSRPLTARRSSSAVELTAMTALLLCIIAARVPYVPMVLLLFLPLWNTAHATRASWLRAVAAAAALLFVLGAWQHAVHPLGIALGAGADPPSQVLFMRTHPLATVGHIVWSTLMSGKSLAVHAVAILGINDVYAPKSLYLLLALGTALLALTVPVPCLQTGRARLLVAAALTLTVAAISVAEYIVWTAPGSAKVNGLQARYYLPPLPFALLLLPRAARLRRTWSAKLTYAGIALFVLAALYTPWLAARAFYNTGLFAALQMCLR